MEMIIAARLPKKVGGRAQGSIGSQDEDAREWAEAEGDLRRWAEDNGKTLIIADRNLRWPPRAGASRDEDVARWNRGAEDAHHEWNVTSRRYRRMIRQRTANNELAGSRSTASAPPASSDAVPARPPQRLPPAPGSTSPSRNPQH